MFELENRCTDIDRVWYELYVVRDHTTHVLSNYLQSVVATLAPLIYGPEPDNSELFNVTFKMKCNIGDVFYI
jgi:hypothetical protein